jgi:chorismate mutase
MTPRQASDRSAGLIGSNSPKEDDAVTDPADEARSGLLELRGSIDNIDAAIIHMLAERFRCTQKVGALKAKYGLPPADPKREAEQVARLRELAAAARLDPDFAEKFLAFVIREVIRHHEAVPR